MSVSTILPRAVLIPLLISGSGIAISVFSILIYHFLVLRFCLRRSQLSHNNNQIDDSNYHTGRRLSITGNNTTTTDPVNRKRPGLNKALLGLIPMAHYSSGEDDLERAGGGECAICLGELDAAATVRLLPNCRHHAFHVTCVDTWLASHVTCPICRAEVFPFHHQEKGFSRGPHRAAPASELRRALSMTSSSTSANSDSSFSPCSSESSFSSYFSKFDVGLRLRLLRSLSLRAADQLGMSSDITTTDSDGDGDGDGESGSGPS